MGISPIYENLLSGHRFHFHSPADREIATKIAARVERGVEAQIVPGECEGYPVETGWEGGLYSTAILLLLSPDSVPARVSREDWESALNHFKGNADPPLGAVLVRACPYPKLLEGKNFFRWTDDPIETLRAIERWVLSFHPLPERHSFLESLGLDRQGPLPLQHRTAHATGWRDRPEWAPTDDLRTQSRSHPESDRRRAARTPERGLSYRFRPRPGSSRPFRVTTRPTGGITGAGSRHRYREDARSGDSPARDPAGRAALAGDGGLQPPWLRA